MRCAPRWEGLRHTRSYARGRRVTHTDLTWQAVKMRWHQRQVMYERKEIIRKIKAAQ